MARPTRGRAGAQPAAELVSGNLPSTLAASASVARGSRPVNVRHERNTLAKPWQREVYRHVGICGEARYAAALFANMAARAEIGISERNALGRKAVWVSDGPEVDIFEELCPSVQDRKHLIRTYMIHHVLVGESYLIARERQETDVDPDNPLPIWEIVAVTELQKVGTVWKVRFDNGNYVDLAPEDPVIRLWNPDPEDRREAWSAYKSLLPTLREIEFLTRHIFTQVQSRLMSSGVWFLPNDLTFANPPADAVSGGEEAIAGMNEAERFMASLAAASMELLEGDDVAMPTVVMADPLALSNIDQSKLIEFWSKIDDAAMVLRSDAVRRFALGVDLPPEQVLGASGLAVSGTSGSAGSVNHWGVWANEEQTISNHIEPALDTLVTVLTVAVIREIIPNTTRVVAYDTAGLRLRQDRSKEALELNERGLLSGEVTLRENGFDPEFDMMTDTEWKRWMLTRVAGGSATPEQVNESLRMLGIILSVDFDAPSEPKALAPGQPGRNEPPSLDEHPYEGPPRVQHDQSPAPFSVGHASAEGLVLRAMEKAGNRLLNSGKRGRDRDRSTPPLMAHMQMEVFSDGMTVDDVEFDFNTLPFVFSTLPASQQARLEGVLTRYCRNLYASRAGYTREGLIEALKGL